jgi:CHAD domain-containing protein
MAVGRRSLLDVRTRCLTEIGRAQRALAATHPDNIAIHQARRSIKRARAMLHLLKTSLPARRYQTAARRLTLARKTLAAARDAAVQHELLIAIGTAVGVSGLALSTESTHSAVRLRREHQSLRAELARRTLSRIQDLLKTSALRDDDSQLPRALIRIYRHGRRAWRCAARTGTLADLHKLRKSTKHYLHTLEVFHQPSDKSLIRQTTLARHLCEMLGRYNDNAALRARVPNSHMHPNARKKMMKAIGERQSKLHAGAIAQGQQLYRRRPRDLSPAAHRWWRRFQSMSTHP